jgi:hypothetical protein
MRNIMFSKVSSQRPASSTPSSGSEQQAIPPNVTIICLISKQEWSFLEHFLSNFGLDLPINDNGIGDCVTADIVVHFVARFQAPLRNITLLSNYVPPSLESSDTTGRYPIHVAASFWICLSE